jgi:predicted phosphoribosyltransferase
MCLEVPEYFHAVGQAYSDFPQVSDEQVISLLAREQARHSVAPRAAS